MKKVLFFSFLIIVLMMFFLHLVSFAQEKDKKSIKYFEVYREVGKGRDLREAKEDAYQNAIIEFLKKNVSAKNIKENSQKLLKELLSSSKIKNFVESEKIISQEDSGDGQKIIIDVVLRVGKIVEVLQRLEIPLKETSEFYQDNSSNQSEN